MARVLRPFGADRRRRSAAIIEGGDELDALPLVMFPGNRVRRPMQGSAAVGVAQMRSPRPRSMLPIFWKSCHSLFELRHRQSQSQLNA